MNLDIKEILFWIFLILGMILLLWNVFGGSPTEFSVIITIIFTILLKVWSISDRQLKHETKFNILKDSFVRLTVDFKELAKDFKVYFHK